MKESIFRVSLDIHTLQSQMTLGVKKGETSRKLCVSLTEHGMPYTIGEKCFATFQGTKADGTRICDNCTIENNQIVYSFTKQTTAVSGIINADFILYSVDGGIIASPHITIVVDERAIGSADTIVSEDELLLLDNIALAEAERVAAEELRDVAEDGRGFAETGRVEAEAIRVLSEDERKIAEADRKTSEDARKKDFEEIMDEGTSSISALNRATNNAINIVKEIQDKLDKGDFIGEKGEKGDKGDSVIVITEEVNAGDLDYGIYHIDGNNGGCVNLPEVNEDYFLGGGMVFVSPNADFSGKQVVVYGISASFGFPFISTYLFDEDGNFADIYDTFTSKEYVEARVSFLQKQIDELKATGTSGADGTVYRPFVEELDSNIEVADYSAELV